ncbi:MAG: phosphoenolpyruvate synthase [Methanobacteriota archaeon]|nr:MAG: phosphoenolpyruvate synthase [Euryarchaeota archaeon]
MNIAWFSELTKDDIPLVGGKGANLGEMTKAGLPVPEGFVVTAKAYESFIKASNLSKKLEEMLRVDVDDSAKLQAASKKIRKLIEATPVPEKIKKDVTRAYKKLGNGKDVYVAVRSSATAEDLPDASFAGQQETFLNTRGEEELLKNMRKCWSSLFTPRAIFYRIKHGFDHSKVLIAVVVQRMVDADKAGVMFTVHPATGEKDKLVIEGAWGLGEGVVSGTVTPDHYVMDKESERLLEKEIARKETMFIRNSKGRTEQVETPKEMQTKQVLSEEELVKITRLGKLLESHYGKPQDVEWAIEDGSDPYLTQTRPITVLYAEGEEKEEEAGEGRKVIVKGLGASPGTASGPVKILQNVEELDKVKEGDVLVTTMTNPDMVPAMKRAVAIVTEEGGMTCHAAIVSRELGIPSIVGTGNATQVLKDGMVITVDGSRGVVYEGSVKAVEAKPETVTVARPQVITATEVKVNLSVPDEKVARRMAAIADGVGLLRVEHIILGMGRHPISFIQGGDEEEFVERLYRDLKIVVDAFYPKIVYIRTLDAPTDEFRSMKGGEDEPYEHNPMLGWRGIRRGLDQPEILRAELKAIKRLVEENYTNIGVMIPLVHHPDQVREAKRIAEEVGVIPQRDVKFGIMVETPASAVAIEDFIKVGLDFISFGTNDLTQYTLALDRNNERVAKHFTEKHPAVLKLIQGVIDACNRHGVETSICGQAGSDPEVVKQLVKFGITSVSANPDAVEKVRETVAREEKRLLLENARRNAAGRST